MGVCTYIWWDPSFGTEQSLSVHISEVIYLFVRMYASFVQKGKHFREVSSFERCSPKNH